MSALFCDTGRLSHAYLLSGGGTMEQALLLAQYLNCEDAEGGLPCGLCPACKKVLAGVHPDVHIVEPAGVNHRIKDLREMQEQANLQPYIGKYKVFIITDAERMDAPAANCLLKTLEEPPAQTVLVLISGNNNKLLPTILSRCQAYTCSSAAEAAAAAELQLVADMADSAYKLLMDLPQLSQWQALQLARVYEKDKDSQLAFYIAVWQLLHQAARRDLELPYSAETALQAALMLETCIDYQRRNINQKLLADVVYLRLWQMAQSDNA
ncbi:MAG: hypothetical protein IKM70_02715 [Firmicutes bacterium]|nr:hypothetical protein [Bacillota bacterium]